MSETELRLERLIAAPPERLFALWTEPAQLARWWGPEGFTVPEHSLDVRPGGAWRTTMRSPEGQLNTVSGVYHIVEPPRRLVFTWAWEDEKGLRGQETEVVVSFAPAPGGTKLTLVQREFAAADSCRRHEQGWIATLRRLEQFAAASVG